MSIWLIGAGPMAVEYARVLTALQEDFLVIGRSEKTAKNFSRATGKDVITGGLQKVIKNLVPTNQAIVAVGIEELVPATKLILNAGTRRVLLEKPGAIDIFKMEELQKVATENHAEVLIAYNRRFYSSTLRAEELIAEDGGITSLHFEFTEWSHILKNLKTSSQVMEKWVLSNSSHILDLAFFLAGSPWKWQGWRNGGTKWHPSASRFCGAGITKNKVLFSYFADWEAPGRWGIEALTLQRRFIFRPMEKLQVLKLGETEVEPVKIDYKLDQDFKPGLYLQTEAFLRKETDRFCTLEEQLENTKLYYNIAGYE